MKSSIGAPPGGSSARRHLRISRKADDGRQNHATQFFKSVGYVLPRNKCRAHYNEEVKRNPPKVDSRDALSRWLAEVHNKVNRENGKREWSHDEVRKAPTETPRHGEEVHCTATASVHAGANDHLSMAALLVIVYAVMHVVKPCRCLFLSPPWKKNMSSSIKSFVLGRTQCSSNRHSHRKRARSYRTTVRCNGPRIRPVGEKRQSYWKR